MVCCLHDGDNDDNNNDGDGSSDDETHLGGNTLSIWHGEQMKLHYLHVFPPLQVEFEKAQVSYASGTQTHIQNLPHVL